MMGISSLIEASVHTSMIPLMLGPNLAWPSADVGAKNLRDIEIFCSPEVGRQT